MLALRPDVRTHPPRGWEKGSPLDRTTMSVALRLLQYSR